MDESLTQEIQQKRRVKRTDGKAPYVSTRGDIALSGRARGRDVATRVRLRDCGLYALDPMASFYASGSAEESEEGQGNTRGDASRSKWRRMDAVDPYEKARHSSDPRPIAVYDRSGERIHAVPWAEIIDDEGKTGRVLAVRGGLFIAPPHESGKKSPIDVARQIGLNDAACGQLKHRADALDAKLAENVLLLSERLEAAEETARTALAELESLREDYGDCRALVEKLVSETPAQVAAPATAEEQEAHKPVASSLPLWVHSDEGWLSKWHDDKSDQSLGWSFHAFGSALHLVRDGVVEWTVNSGTYQGDDSLLSPSADVSLLDTSMSILTEEGEPESMRSRQTRLLGDFAVAQWLDPASLNSAAVIAEADIQEAQDVQDVQEEHQQEAKASTDPPAATTEISQRVEELSISALDGLDGSTLVVANSHEADEPDREDDEVNFTADASTYSFTELPSVVAAQGDDGGELGASIDLSSIAVVVDSSFAADLTSPVQEAAQAESAASKPRRKKTAPGSGVASGPTARRRKKVVIATPSAVPEAPRTIVMTQTPEKDHTPEA
ncbi:hypothetical protein ml_299 [Mollivirus sibericum]|uniref:hypothetical protein n=1 Tax=Mollivirus sibericum TaxID=1678078 RepID=UPI0006B2E32C|nr:hypothetical protein ml_299 [Mollivirus sibericum]ALD62101.1 hypothetical protein ml_299 [Mollivirus sibericum]